MGRFFDGVLLFWWWLFREGDWFKKGGGGGRDGCGGWLRGWSELIWEYIVGGGYIGVANGLGLDVEDSRVVG